MSRQAGKGLLRGDGAYGKAGDLGETRGHREGGWDANCFSVVCGVDAAN